MHKNEFENIDILKELEFSLETPEINTSEIIETSINEIENNESLSTESITLTFPIEKISEEAELIWQANESEKSEDILETIEITSDNLKAKRNSLVSWIIFLTKYVLTSSLIFAVLLVTTNYSAYINIAKSYVFAWDLEISRQKIISSVEASNIKERYAEVVVEENEEEKRETEKLSIKKIKQEQDRENIDLNIEITPYANRVVIPKIGQNIPLIDIKNRKITWENEFNDIIMEELESGIVRYPGSAKPWEDGTSFIFWHSSNFPWVKWDYNDVFALLDKVEYGDEIIIYYWQEKYVYKIKEKKVITPWDVSVLERNKDKSEITLMTCWPIGTTLNRLIVTWELINEIN